MTSSGLLLTAFVLGVASHVTMAEADEPDTVHVIFMNHLDVGYNGIAPQTGYINNILNIYFHEYFPRAAMLAETLRVRGFKPGFIYTTHPWVVSMFINCPPNLVLNGIKLKCPNDDEVRVFERAVRMGDITWHAGPMNMQPENMNKLLFELSLNVSSDLDNRFGIIRRFKTLSQRDVPGMSQAVLPAMVRREILAVSVGVNPDSAPPAVPRGLFLWQYGQFSAIATWHPGGYPLNPGTSPRHPGGLSRNDCVTTNSLNHALCFAFRQDNTGPPKDIMEIYENYEILEAEFPGATIKASTFENFVEAILPYAYNLPVYRGEIGDTWMMGVASDPRKMAEYRTISSAITACVKAGYCDTSDPAIMDTVRYLIKLPEHTWGLPGVNDNVNWTNSAFQRVRSGGIFLNSSRAWSEQRRFAQLAVDALGDHPVAKNVTANLAKLIPIEPQPLSQNFSKIPYKPDTKFRCNNGIQMSFGQGGELSHLYDPFNQITWANGSDSLVHFLYRTYAENDFAGMVTEYNYRPANKFGTGIHKINVDEYANPVSTFWNHTIVGLYQRLNSENGCEFLLHVEIEDKTAHTYYGSPDRLWLHYLVKDSNKYPGPDVVVTVQWFEKTATRLPEALFLGFRPAPQPGFIWRVRKLGELIDPLSVGLNGSQHFHGIDDAIFYTDEDMRTGLRIDSIDVPLVCPYELNRDPSPFPVPLQPIKSVHGMAFNFYNNIWDTNYILWYPYLDGDDKFKSRFSITFLK